jgi:hypothetical protein
MNEILSMMALEALTGLLLALGSFLCVAALVPLGRRSWLGKARLLEGGILCLAWGNWVLACFLVPRFAHGSALAPGAGPGPGASYVVVDPYGQRAEVSEDEFAERRRYEEGSSRLPWYLTPPAVLVLVAGWLAARKRDRGDRTGDTDAVEGGFHAGS